MKKPQASLSPAQAKRTGQSTTWFEKHGRNEGIPNYPYVPRKIVFDDYWVRIDGNATVSGVLVYTWTHMVRKAHNTFATHPDGVTSSSSSPDTRAFYLGTGVLATNDIVRAIVDIDEYGIITYTIEGDNICSTGSPTTVGGNAEGSESADSTTWAFGSTPIDLWVIGRVGYFESGDKKLYSYARKLSFNSCGILIAVSAETRIIVDATEACT